MLVRVQQPFTLSTLPPNGVVTLPPWMGIEDAITALHQRGKVVLTAQGQRVNGHHYPLMGITTNHSGLNYVEISPPRNIGFPFQIPSGYDRFSLIIGYYLPPMNARLAAVLEPAKVTFAAGFTSGPNAFHEITTVEGGINQQVVQLFDGRLPVTANNGYMSNHALHLGISVTAISGEDIQGWRLEPVSGRWWGVDFLVLALYRDAEC